MSPVEVIYATERRRRWSARQKQMMVEEAEQPGNTISSVARKHEVHLHPAAGNRSFVSSGRLPLSELKKGLYLMFEKNLVDRRKGEIKSIFTFQLTWIRLAQCSRCFMALLFIARPFFYAMGLKRCL